MGVDYSATVAWGIVVDELEPVFGDDKYIDEFEVNNWLRENGYEYIECVEGGDFMNGETFFIFALKGTVKRLDWREAEGLVTFDEPHRPYRAQVEFNKIKNEPFVKGHDTESWKLMFNVS